MFSKILPIAAIAGTTVAHGIVKSVTADGVYYPGYIQDYYYAAQNGGEVTESVGWYHESLDNGYVGGDRTAYDSEDIICHKAAKNAALSAKVAAGGTIAFHWSDWPSSHIGPMITYAANCGGDCTTVDKAALKFVKIEEAGYDGEWAAIQMIANNNTWETTVPSSLPAGNYVFRHETIALHGAGSLNGAQNYPFCVNVEVTGSGTGSTDADGVLGTALYTSEDLVFNPYTGSIDYPIPGPALWTGAGSGSTPTTPTSSSAPSATATSGAGSSTAAPTATATATPTAVDTPATTTATTVPISTGYPVTPVLASEFSIAELSAWLVANTDATKQYTVEEIATLLTSASGKVRRHARQFL